MRVCTPILSCLMVWGKPKAIFTSRRPSRWKDIAADFRLLHSTEWQPAQTQALEIGDGPLRVVVNLNVDHLCIVFFDAPQLWCAPTLCRSRPDSSDILPARWAGRTGEDRFRFSPHHQAREDRRADTHPKTPGASGIAYLPGRPEALLSSASHFDRGIIPERPESPSELKPELV